MKVPPKKFTTTEEVYSKNWAQIQDPKQVFEFILAFQHENKQREEQQKKYD